MRCLPKYKPVYGPNVIQVPSLWEGFACLCFLSWDFASNSSSVLNFLESFGVEVHSRQDIRPDINYLPNHL